jgi:hypothetical protein
MAFALQQRLLRMTACGLDSRADVEDLSTGDWAQVLMMVRQHRLGPLLHWRLDRNGSLALLPKPFVDAIAGSFRRHTLRATELLGEVARVQRIMRENEIPAVFVNGAYLAFNVYSQAALRPVRNLDVLVPESQAGHALHALKSSTLRRWGNVSGKSKFPILVELRTRLADPPGPWRAARRADPAFNAGTWNRLTCSLVGEEEVWYLSPEDQLLHLIINALANTRRCGPLLLTDIAGLLSRTAVDWPRFWRIAARGRWVAGCWLWLVLARYWYPTAGFLSPDDVELPALPRDLAGLTATLTLGQPQERVAAWRQLKLQARSRPLHYMLELLAG